MRSWCYTTYICSPIPIWAIWLVHGHAIQPRRETPRQFPRYWRTRSAQGRENPNFEWDVDDQVTSIVRLIRAKYIPSGSGLKPLDLVYLPLYFILNIIFKVVFCTEFGFLKTDSDDFDYIKVVYKHSVSMMICLCSKQAHIYPFTQQPIGSPPLKGPDEMRWLYSICLKPRISC